MLSDDQPDLGQVKLLPLFNPIYRNPSQLAFAMAALNHWIYYHLLRLFYRL
jgi:hypothetical protein